MDYEGILTEAREAVEGAGLDDELRTIGFELVVARMLNLSPAAPPATPAPQQSTSVGSAAATPDTVNTSTGLAQLAAKLAVDLAIVENVYDWIDDQLELVVPPGKLEAPSSGAARQIALLLTAGRQGSGIEDYTEYDEIREWCSRYKKLDSSNFSAHMRDLEDVFLVRGSARKREVKMTMPAWEKAADLVRQLGER